MSPKEGIRQFLRTTLGVDIVRFSPVCHHLARRAALLEALGIDMVLDVGANVGQFGRQLRSIGYAGSIRSFEPLTSAYARLEDEARKDPNWAAYNYALGKETGLMTINISGNSYSSSFKNMLPAHVHAVPISKFVDSETVQVRTLDTVLAEKPIEETHVLLKIDTQGSEREVLEGGSGSLAMIDTIQLEMSLTPLYEDSGLFHESVTRLMQMGYDLVGIEPGFTDRETGRMLQVDGIFHRYA